MAAASGRFALFFIAGLLAAPFGAAAQEDAEARTAGWIRTFAAAPVDTSEAFEAPDFHGTLIEDAARRIMIERLEARGFQLAPSANDARLTFSVSVETPGPKGRKPLPKSPIQISSYDRDPTDTINDPKLYAEWVDHPRTQPKDAPQIRVTVYARRGGERVWSGYAGAPAGGASREEIAGGLVAALIDYFGESVDLTDAVFTLAETAPAVRIIEPVEE